MITLCRANERRHDRHHRHEIWHTFHTENRADAVVCGFGPLQMLSEDRLPPGATIQPSRHCGPHRNVEIVTYVREGALAHDDTMGHSGVLYGGEFQRVTARRGVRRRETNGSQIDWAHVFRVGIHSSEADLTMNDEQKRFYAAERRGAFCIVASPDGRKQSLHIHQDVLMFSAILDPGQHVVHELSLGRSAWLHLVLGEVMLGDVVLNTGDGVGVTVERAVSLTAHEETELLLVDLGPEPRFVPIGDMS